MQEICWRRVNRSPLAETFYFVVRSSTQSESPAEFWPGVVKTRVPELANGDPETVLKFPLVGSYHCAVTEPEYLLKSNVRLVDTGA